MAGLFRSLTRRSDERPVAAMNVPTVAASPEVERKGLVLPRLNRPHSGWPLLPQPAEFLLSASTSDQPIALFGQPSASAMGLGMASTSGVLTMLGFESASICPWSLADRSCRSRPSQVLAAGVHTSGFGPSTDSFQPRARADSAPPDAFPTTLTSTHWPLTDGFV